MCVSLFEGPGQQLLAILKETCHCVCIIIRKDLVNKLDSILKESDHCLFIIIRRTWSTSRHNFERNLSLCIIFLKVLNRSRVLKSFHHIQMKSIYVKRFSERYFMKLDKQLTAKIVNHSTLFFKYFERTYYVGLWWESGKCSSDRNIAVRDTHRFDSRAVSSDRNVAARDTQVRVSGRTTRAPPLSCIYLIIVMLIFNIFNFF